MEGIRQSGATALGRPRAQGQPGACRWIIGYLTQFRPFGNSEVQML